MAILRYIKRKRPNHGGLHLAHPGFSYIYLHTSYLIYSAPKREIGRILPPPITAAMIAATMHIIRLVKLLRTGSPDLTTQFPADRRIWCNLGAVDKLINDWIFLLDNSSWGLRKHFIPQSSQLERKGIMIRNYLKINISDMTCGP